MACDTDSTGVQVSVSLSALFIGTRQVFSAASECALTNPNADPALQHRP